VKSAWSQRWGWRNITSTGNLRTMTMYLFDICCCDFSNERHDCRSLFVTKHVSVGRDYLPKRHVCRGFSLHSVNDSLLDNVDKSHEMHFAYRRALNYCNTPSKLLRVHGVSFAFCAPAVASARPECDIYATYAK